MVTPPGKFSRQISSEQARVHIMSSVAQNPHATKKHRALQPEARCLIP
jgi:hypothetical protein